MSNSSTALVRWAFTYPKADRCSWLTDLLGGACCRFGKILWLMIHLIIDVGSVEYSRAAWRVLLSHSDIHSTDPTSIIR